MKDSFCTICQTTLASPSSNLFAWQAGMKAVLRQQSGLSRPQPGLKRWPLWSLSAKPTADTIGHDDIAGVSGLNEHSQLS